MRFLAAALLLRLIVPFAPGGSVGNDYVAKSPPDGHTLTVGTLGPFAKLTASGFDA